MDMCVIEQKTLSLIQHTAYRCLFWLALVTLFSLFGEAIDGAISLSDLSFTLNFVIPCALLALVYIGLALISNNYGQELRLIWNGAQLQYDRYGQSQIFLPSQIRMAKLEGKVTPQLTLYLSNTDSPRRLSLEGLPLAECEDLLQQLSFRIESSEKTMLRSKAEGESLANNVSLA
ncbi:MULTISPECIES: hypothetical protein [Corallincola]|uniref:DUF304 domain-containing protein n=2 Tax=Corallincola TaxID=1775176 RepID=A0ABY1WPU6_9GAMM|nr:MULTISPECIES: hypothetical protein [Corallincola]TAA45958.1 hypothetical protein EXY25_11455 [Corallincola spongiicola]TCI04066.1 hypothetical protein EZV61_07705 [Corallincola luteus]